MVANRCYAMNRTARIAAALAGSGKGILAADESAATMNAPGGRRGAGHRGEPPFPDYTLDQLAAIGDLIPGRQGYRLSDRAQAVFGEYLARRTTQPRFANARSVRNALERARLRQASRLVAAAPLGTDDFMRLEPADFHASRVFSGQHP
jgi:hypothetical protein